MCKFLLHMLIFSSLWVTQDNRHMTNFYRVINAFVKENNRFIQYYLVLWFFCFFGPMVIFLTFGFLFIQSSGFGPDWSIRPNPEGQIIRKPEGGITDEMADYFQSSFTKLFFDKLSRNYTNWIFGLTVKFGLPVRPSGF